MNTPSLFSLRRLGRAPAFRFALAATLAVFSAACHRLTYSTHAVGHYITARIEGDTRSIETLPTQAILRGSHGVVRIERDRVRIDENPWLAIPTDVTVDVTISRHTVRVKVGNVSTERTTND